jgi:hypothetical protein
VRIAVLNGCYTADASPAIITSIDGLVGSTKEIADNAALDFARGFYTGLRRRSSVFDAFELGKSEIGNGAPRPGSRGANPGVFDPKIVVATAKTGIDLKELYL